MSYRLHVTRPDGTVTQTSVEPLATMTAVGLSALRFLGAEITTGLKIVDVKRFGARLRDTPLGETLKHDSGYSFRTEEF